MAKGAVLVVAMGVVAIGCGGGGGGSGPDYSGNFTGEWSIASGSFGLVLPPNFSGAAPPVESNVGPLTITSDGLNTIHIKGVCPGGDALVMDVVSPTDLSGRKYTCAPSDPLANCPVAPTIAIDGGSGLVVNGVLTLGLNGTYSYCGEAYVINYTFSGSRIPAS